MDVDSSKKFSPSKLKEYQICPRRYAFHYIERIPRERTSVEALLGVCVHAALEALYQNLQNGRLMTILEVLGVYDAEWERRWNSEAIAVFEPGLSGEHYRAVGREALTLYDAAHRPFAEDKTVAVECRVGFPLLAGGEIYRIEGFVDRLALASDGAFEIHDYKTSRSLPEQSELEADWQLALYDAAVRHAWPDTKTVRLRWHYLRFGKTLGVAKTVPELDSLKKDVARLILEIKGDRRFAPQKNALCPRCEYRAICPLFKHAEEVSRMPVQESGIEEGVLLVERLADIVSRKKAARTSLRAIEEEEKATEAELLSYAQGRGLLAVHGSRGYVSMSEKEEIHLPTKTHAPEGHDRLEAALKESPLWPEISKLDGHRLVEGLKDGHWDDASRRFVEELLLRYAKRETSWILRFHPSKEEAEE